jgi:hypothetical protein
MSMIVHSVQVQASVDFWDNNMIQDKVEMSLLAEKLRKLPEVMVRMKSYTT